MSAPYTRDRDRPRPGANQFGAGSPNTQQGARETPIMTEPDVEFADWAPRLGMLEMSDDRRALIWGLYRLAAWVADHPELPVPDVVAKFWPRSDGWEAECAFVDRVAAGLGVTAPLEADGDFYEVKVSFGLVEVRAVAIRPERMARYYATQSYADAVTPDTPAGGEVR